MALTQFWVKKSEETMFLSYFTFLVDPLDLFDTSSYDFCGKLRNHGCWEYLRRTIYTYVPNKGDLLMAREKAPIPFVKGLIFTLITLEVLAGPICVYFASIVKDVRIKPILEGVGVGFVSAGVLFLTAEATYHHLGSIRLKEIIDASLKRMTALGQHGLSAVYRTRSEITHLYLEVFREAKFITICGISAKDLVHDAGILDMLVSRAEQGCRLRIVLSHPDSEFLRKRSMEEYGNEATLPQEVRDSINFLEPKLKKGKRLKERLQVFLYDTYPQGSLIVTDKRVFFGPYLFVTRGGCTPWIEFEHGRKSVADLYGAGDWTKESKGKEPKGHVERIIEKAIPLQKYLEERSHKQ
jgi:hypothetical protein